MYNNDYIEQGIIIKPNVVAEGDKLSIIYEGLLVNSGADQVYCHVGYGGGNEWSNTGYIKMARTANGFETLMTVDHLSNVHMCFKDSAANWDNNSGKNYVFNVQAR